MLTIKLYHYLRHLGFRDAKIYKRSVAGADEILALSQLSKLETTFNKKAHSLSVMIACSSFIKAPAW